SEGFQRMLSLVARVAPSRATVLLLGESGTGKELVARAVHEASTRASKPLVAVDCSSLPENLFESELFGHDRGAFTGANTAKGGLVEAASGGTLFLDELGDIPLPMQVKLLRLLETGTYRRVGSTELRHADIRVVCATHRDLVRMVSEGRFREDLYYRLSTFPILLPPLREREGDIALLAPALLQRVTAPRHIRLSPGALRLLEAQPFPGNIRELRNLLERTALLCDGDVIEANHVAQALATAQPSPHRAPVTAFSPAPTPRESAGPIENDQGVPHPRPLGLKAMARETLRQRLLTHQGSRAELAAELGISERSLYRKIKALQTPGPR
ncbi:MAG TPA: sigma-54 dependent transcriptional regulator, partial [Hydrogenophaga sp.]